MSTRQATVAICIPTFNQAQYLLESVGSACQQTYPGVEVWVSDDASPDETPAIMAQLGEQFPQIRYHRQPHNLGIAGNNSWLLRQPDTEFIVRLDSDDSLDARYVERLVALLQKHPTAGYAHAAIQEINEHSQPTRVRRLARTEEFLDAETALRASVYGYRVAANICIFRSQALRELNFYEGRPNYAEDYDLSVRMADAGYGNVYANEILASYRVWTDAGQVRPKRKNIELQGLVCVHEESLLPAFQKRGWDTQILYRHRRQLAVRYAIWADSPVFTEAERAELIRLLKALGDSPALTRRLWLLNRGFGAWIQWRNTVLGNIKDQVKYWLSRRANTLGKAES